MSAPPPSHTSRTQRMGANRKAPEAPAIQRRICAEIQLPPVALTRIVPAVLRRSLRHAVHYTSERTAVSAVAHTRPSRRGDSGRACGAKMGWCDVAPSPYRRGSSSGGPTA